MRRVATLMLCLALAAPAAPSAAFSAAAPAYPGVSPFAAERLETRRRETLRRLAAGDAAGAAAALRPLIAASPRTGALHAALAVALAATGAREAALDSLAQAAKLGTADLPAYAASAPLAALGADAPVAARIAAVLAAAVAPPPGAPPPAPGLVGLEQTALVREAITRWRSDAGMLESSFQAAPALRRRPARGPGDTSAAAGGLNRLVARGRAAGNFGDLYDNRDGDHSTLWRAAYPQLGFVEYDDAARAAGLHYGLNTRILFDAPTFGNSSTAIGQGPFWRSQARAALTSPDGVAALWRQYAANHVYVYPEHRDHDPDRGDLFPALTPYMLVSQGSSGSDRPVLNAVAAILAALRPDTKALLRAEGLIAPTVQMLLRRNLTTAPAEKDYLSATAWPSVIEAEMLDVDRMIAAANALTPGEVPPMARFAGVEETRPALGLFADGLSETLFDSPAAMARVARRAQGPWRYVLHAGEIADPNDRPISYHWRVLRGDPAHVRLIPQQGGRAAALEIDWLAPYPAPSRPDLTTNRVDVALFVHNGAQYSAPALFSLAFSPKQTRVHDAAGRVLSVDYADPAQARVYADPMIFPARDWRDDFAYDAEGRLAGWTRTRKSVAADYTRSGARVLRRDAEGRPVCAEIMRYPVERARDGTLAVSETPSGETVAYRYRDAADRLGEISAEACDGA